METYKKETIATYNLHASKYEAIFQESMEEHAMGNIDHFISRLKGPKVLDAGCGPGVYLDQFRKRGIDALGIDLSDAFLEIAQSKGLNVRKMDMESPLLYPHSFDGIWSAATVQHIPRERLASTFQTWAKLLKKDGLLWISLRQRKNEKDGCSEDPRFPGSKRWVTPYTQEELHKALAKQFEVIQSMIEHPESDKPYFKILAQVKPDIKSVRNF